MLLLARYLALMLPRFLVASLQLDMLRECRNIRELRAAIECLPNGVNAMYEKTMQRIEDQTEPGMAKRALVVLVHALESLYMDDLRHAIAVDPDTHQHDPELLIDSETLISICCGLITFEPQSRLVRLVREFTFYFTSFHHCLCARLRLHSAGLPGAIPVQGWR